MPKIKTLSDLTLDELWDLFPITLKDYNPIYEDYYKEEKDHLWEILTNFSIKRISHIGSTSIMGIKSKPIIDILLEIENIKELSTIKEILISNNWLLMSERNNPLKISFNKGYTINGYAEKVFHLHIKLFGDCDELYFRDYMNDHKEIAKKYEELKEELLKQYGKDRDAYTNAKTEFVLYYTNLAKEKYNYRYN